MSQVIDKLYELLEPTINELGFELWGIEYFPSGKYATLRIYIDSEQGIQLDDCEKVTREVSALLDVEDPIRSQYTLEVSSPGLDRVLFKAEQFSFYVGEMLQFQLLSAVNGQKKFKGILKSVDEDGVEVEVDNQLLTVPFAVIGKARIVPDFDKLKH